MRDTVLPALSIRHSRMANSRGVRSMVRSPRTTRCCSRSILKSPTFDELAAVEELRRSRPRTRASNSRNEKWFDQTIVGSLLQRQYQVLGTIPRGQHQHAQCGLGQTHPLQQLHSVDSGQVQVKYHQVVDGGLQGFPGGLAIERDLDRKELELERATEKFA